MSAGVLRFVDGSESGSYKGRLKEIFYRDVTLVKYFLNNFETLFYDFVMSENFF